MVRESGFTKWTSADRRPTIYKYRWPSTSPEANFPGGGVRRPEQHNPLTHTVSSASHLSTTPARRCGWSRQGSNPRPSGVTQNTTPEIIPRGARCQWLGLLPQLNFWCSELPVLVLVQGFILNQRDPALPGEGWQIVGGWVGAAGPVCGCSGVF